MPFNGAGGFTVYTPGNPAVPGTAISSAAFNATMNDVATGLVNTLTRDGQSPAIANIPMGGNKITGLGPATVAGQAVRFEQLPTLASLGAAASGANTDITSLGAVTGVTATAGDSTTKLATTAFVAGAALVPVGSIIDYAGTSAPTGYLACPVSATNISRTTYAALFTAIGTTWGTGDGSTTFGMPWFPANYSSVQANSNVGTSTAGQVIAHTHNAIFSSGPGGGSQYPIASASDTATASGATTSTGGSANLAAGVRVLKCVKY